jgi:hypothetical protein
VLPEPPTLLPPSPPPPNTLRRWALVAAVALILALVAATLTGSLLVSRLIGAAVSVTVRDDPTTLTLPSLPSEPRPPDAADLAALQSLLLATPSTAGVTVDEMQARGIVEALWPIREHDIDTARVAAFGSYERGVALEGDATRYASGPCGCAAARPRSITSLYLFVPRQTAYPADFLAEVTTQSLAGAQPGVVFMVFTRPSAVARWEVSLATGYATAANTPVQAYVVPARATDGFDAAASTNGTDVSALPADLAAYYQHWASTGSAPPDPTFAPGLFTSYQGGKIFTFGETVVFAGLHREVYSAGTPADGEWSFAADSLDETPADGWLLSCGTVRYEDFSTAARGVKPLTQPPDLSIWGPSLPAGQYSQVTQSGLHESCFLSDPTGAPTIVLGTDGGASRSTGVPVVAPAS